MTDSKHTRWAYEYDNDAGPGDEGFVEFYRIMDEARGEIARADDEDTARLIASAPDLLAERDRLKAANAELVKALRRAIIAFEWSAKYAEVEADKQLWMYRADSARAALARASEQKP